MRHPLFLFLFFMVIFASGVSAYDGVYGSGTEEQESSIMIAGYQASPEVLMRNDIGTGQ